MSRRSLVWGLVMLSASIGCPTVNPTLRLLCDDENACPAEEQCVDGRCVSGGARLDAGQGPDNDRPDAGVWFDAGNSPDGGAQQRPDGGEVNGVDAGSVDAGSVDPEPVDAGVAPDAGAVGGPDAGPVMDGGVVGTPDAGAADAGLPLVPVEGAEVVWDFNEGSGDVAFDSAGVMPAADLAIEATDNVTWVAGGLRLDSATRLNAQQLPRLVQSCLATDEISIEAWVTPTTDGGGNAGRILAFGLDGNNQNFLLGQHDGEWVVRLRTTATNDKGVVTGVWGFETAGALPAQTYHLLARWRGTGSIGAPGGPLELWVNGSLASADADWTGSFSDQGSPEWDDNHILVVGHSADTSAASRAWLGTLHSVSVYCRHLDDAEVTQNFGAGPR